MKDSADIGKGYAANGRRMTARKRMRNLTGKYEDSAMNLCVFGTAEEAARRIEETMENAENVTAKHPNDPQGERTEAEKMRAGQWYDANFDPELVSQRASAAKLNHAFNLAVPESEEQTGFLQQLLHEEIPEGVTVLAPVYFDYGCNTHLGKGTFVNHGCYFMDGAEITLGENVFVGPFCGFYTATHPLSYPERNQGLEKALPITVGDNCWFGANVSVMQGVTIGSGCVIAAGSVVKSDIPDHCMAAGVPAKVKKRIDQNCADACKSAESGL